MIFATLMATAALQVVAVPPPPPVSPAPPLPPSEAHDGSQVMSFEADGRHVTIIKRREGEHGQAFSVDDSGQHVLRYRDIDGRDVTVVTDKAVTQADAEKMEREMRAKIPSITAKAKAMAEAQAARAGADAYRRDALRYGEQARRDGEMARHEGELARKEGEKAREYAQVIVQQMKDKDGNWAFDGGPSTAMFRHGEFAGPGDLKALRDEVHALRDEVEALRAQLKSGVSH